MKIVMDYWAIRWRSAVFNSDTGKGRVRWFSKRPERCRGFANKHKGKWYAFWNSAEGLIFQVGDRRWDVKSFDCAHRIDGAKCIFEISKSGRIEYALEYKAPKHFLDIIDIEMEDYFAWVNSVCNDSSIQSALSSSWEVVEAT